MPKHAEKRVKGCVCGDGVLANTPDLMQRHGHKGSFRIVMTSTKAGGKRRSRFHLEGVDANNPVESSPSPQPATSAGLRHRQASGGTPRWIIAVGELAPTGRAKPTVDVTFMFPSPVGATENVGDSAAPTGLAFQKTNAQWVSLPLTRPRPPTAIIRRRQGGWIVEDEIRRKWLAFPPSIIQLMQEKTAPPLLSGRHGCRQSCINANGTDGTSRLSKIS